MLKMDPANTEAQAGLKNIEAGFMTLIKNALKTGRDD